MNELQQIILNVIEEMDAAGVYGTLPSDSIQIGNQLYNQDSYSKGYQGIPFKGAIQKRNFPELINQQSLPDKNLKLPKLTKSKPKKNKNGKQKQKQR
jgi:hypothetical protein